MDYLIGFTLGMVIMFIPTIFAFRNLKKFYEKRIKEAEENKNKIVAWTIQGGEELKSGIEHWRRILKTEEPPKSYGKGYKKGWKVGVNRVCNWIEKAIDMNIQKENKNDPQLAEVTDPQALKHSK